MKKQYQAALTPVSSKNNRIQGERYRFTFLTSRLVRMEYSPQGIFEDRATQMVWNRTFSETAFEAEETDTELKVYTEYLQITYNKEAFSPYGLMVQLKGIRSAGNLPAWHYGDSLEDLGGTARTLDAVDGPCKLSSGVLSRWGFSVLDDSRSLCIGEDGFVVPRAAIGEDLYFFGYGHDYKNCLKDFYALCGKTPMLPRFALGNWWSRYYSYSEESYIALMDQFDQEKIPFSVAVVDMDWHLVDIDAKYGAGWTGFTWNKELFPNPEQFMEKLHDRGMKITLNLHPADGVRAYEDCYKDIAKALGADPDKEQPIAFDLANPQFLEAYFDQVLHPMEREGVDFWWIDWQQGSKTRVEGLDPLWMLNHYHFLDHARDGKRPITFSRYAGPGSHRYPVGFSGDTYISWESLDFQPYFTNTASNIGYGWWSHDIGGHMGGARDNELEARWYQYGVFSPINRLHSTKNTFNGKEPWRYPKEIHEVMNTFLRLRHQMLPYLYTMNYRAYFEDQPLIQPMYYEYPEVEEAYEMPNQYFFGTELMVAPITTKGIEKINRAKVKAWLPEGLWFDFFTDTVYEGGRTLNFYRNIRSIPVLAKAGAIIPMTEQITADAAKKNPSKLTIRVYPGADGAFVLYEDDNETESYRQGIHAKTPMLWKWNQQGQAKERIFIIGAVEGNWELLPDQREYRIEFYALNLEEEAALKDQLKLKVSKNGTLISASCSLEESAGKNKILAVHLPAVDSKDQIEIRFANKIEIQKNNVSAMIYELLEQAEISFEIKEQIYSLLLTKVSLSKKATALQAMELPDSLFGAIIEILMAAV